MEYFNFLESRLAASEALISTASLPNSARSCGEYTRGFFPFRELTGCSLFNAAHTSRLADSIAAEGILLERGSLGFGNDLEDLTEK